MPSPVEQNLHSLIPTTNNLPDQLVSIAKALLAQSKHAAPTLKPEEEIARTFTCCHIACERLSNKLALDLGKIVPPCAPRIYKKLHSYLDGTLTAGHASQPAPPRTDRTVNHTARTPSSIKTSRVVTDAAAAAAAAKTTPSKVSSAKRKRHDEPEEDLVPKRLAQMSQHLCRRMKIIEAIPHVYAGLESAWPYLQVEESFYDNPDTPRKRQRKPSAKAEALQARTSKIDIEEDKLALLLVAVVQLTLSAMRDTEVKEDEVEDIFGELLAYLRDQDDKLAERIYDDSMEEIVLAISSLSTRLQALPFWQSWYSNIPQLVVGQDDTQLSITEDTTMPRVHAAKTPLRRRGIHTPSADPSSIDLAAAGLLPGLCTMFQPALDWLSDENRADYAKWKSAIMQEIVLIEQAT